MSPTKIIVSGTNITAKTTSTIAQILNAIRTAQPMKGTGNPPHLQTKLPPSIAKIIRSRNE